MTSELGRRIAFTLGALLVYRIGSYIPLPGIDPSVWSRFFSEHSNGVLGLFNFTAGGAVARLGVLSLGIAPFLTAAVVVQLAMFVWPGLRDLRTRGERGRRRIVRHTLVLTVLLTLVQANGVAFGLQAVNGLVISPGIVFTLAATLTLTAGTLFLIWLSDQITARGVGNGIAWLLFAGIAVELPSAVVGLFELGRQGVLSVDVIVVVLATGVVVTAFAVFMEKARRRVLVQYAARQVGMADRAAYLSLKLNGAGIVAALIASWIVIVPATIANYLGPDGSPWWHELSRELARGGPLFLFLYGLAIIVCTFLYTALVLDPTEAARTLERLEGVVPGVAPGEETAAHLDAVVTRTTLLGGLYLALICLTPELLISYANVPFYFGGASLLVLVCTVLDVSAHVRGEADVTVGAET